MRRPGDVAVNEGDAANELKDLMAADCLSLPVVRARARFLSFFKLCYCHCVCVSFDWPAHYTRARASVCLRRLSRTKKLALRCVTLRRVVRRKARLWAPGTCVRDAYVRVLKCASACLLARARAHDHNDA